MKMRFFRRWVVLALVLCISAAWAESASAAKAQSKDIDAALLANANAGETEAQYDNEVSLYDSEGRPVAYLADDLTIYLWSGKPVAYFYSGNGATHVYGFNGKHLGWFDKGLIRDSEGDAACGVKSVVRLPQIEPIKSIKEIKPIKSVREIPPIKPISSMTWGDVPCSIFLALGGDD
jgi:hypothetical protein